MTCLWVLLLAACTGNPPPPAPAKPPAAFKASCATPQLSTCTEYTEDAFLLGEEVVKVGCTGSHGVWSPAHCPQTRTLGRCLLTGQTRVYYSGSEIDYSSTSAREDCTRLYEGRWTASR